MFTVYSCCQPFRLLQPVPPNITSFGLNWTVNGQYERPPKNRPQASATPSICPCSVMNCSRPNSDQYRLHTNVVRLRRMWSADGQRQGEMKSAPLLCWLLPFRLSLCSSAK